MTENQKQNFNGMLEALKEIAAYQSPEKLRRDSEKDGEFNGDLSTEK